VNLAKGNTADLSSSRALSQLGSALDAIGKELVPALVPDCLDCSAIEPETVALLAQDHQFGMLDVVLSDDTDQAIANGLRVSEHTDPGLLVLSLGGDSGLELFRPSHGWVPVSGAVIWLGNCRLALHSTESVGAARHRLTLTGKLVNLAYFDPSQKAEALKTPPAILVYLVLALRGGVGVRGWLRMKVREANRSSHPNY